MATNKIAKIRLKGKKKKFKIDLKTIKKVAKQQIKQKKKSFKQGLH